MNARVHGRYGDDVLHDEMTRVGPSFLLGKVSKLEAEE
jgi:hypothetical protein